MKICIGGELDGQVVKNKNISFLTNPEDKESAGYYRQSILIENQIFSFWFSDTMSYVDCAKLAKKKCQRMLKNISR